MSIPVICDRCRAAGIAGEADFSHLGDLLEFTPVPRKTKRIDGWSPERQRAYIAALSATGSKRRAALSIGMQPFGVDQLLKSAGSDSFKAAHDRAMAIAEANGSMKLASGVADAAARQAQLAPPSRLRGLPSPREGEGRGEGLSDDQKWDLTYILAIKLMRKVAQEREARLDGEIVSADFYLRQITFIEMTFDLTATHFGWDAREVLRQLRRGEHSILDIASTEFTDWLDGARRLWQADEGEPERPPYPDVRFLKRRRADDGDYATEQQMYAGAWADPPHGVDKEEWLKLDRAERQALIDRIHAEHAAEQAAWERRAHEEWARQNSPSP